MRLCVFGAGGGDSGLGGGGCRVRVCCYGGGVEGGGGGDGGHDGGHDGGDGDHGRAGLVGGGADAVVVAGPECGVAVLAGVSEGAVQRVELVGGDVVGLGEGCAAVAFFGLLVRGAGC